MLLNKAICFLEIQWWDVLFQWQFSELREVSHLVCANMGGTWPIIMEDGETKSTTNFWELRCFFMRPAKRRFSIVVCLYVTHLFFLKIYFLVLLQLNSQGQLFLGTNIFGGRGGGRRFAHSCPPTSHACVCVFNVSTSSCLQHSAVRSYSVCAYIRWHRLRMCRVLWDVTLLS